MDRLTWQELRDRIQYLGYLASTGEITGSQEVELVVLLDSRQAYPEYQEEQKRSIYLLKLNNWKRQEE